MGSGRSAMTSIASDNPRIRASVNVRRSRNAAGRPARAERSRRLASWIAVASARIASAIARSARRRRPSGAWWRTAAAARASRALWSTSGYVVLTASSSPPGGQDEVVPVDDLPGRLDPQHAGDFRRPDALDPGHLRARVTGDPPGHLFAPGVPDHHRLTRFKRPLHVDDARGQQALAALQGGAGAVVDDERAPGRQAERQPPPPARLGAAPGQEHGPVPLPLE